LEQAIREFILPVYRTENPVQLNQNWGVLLIRPSVFATMEGNFFEGHIINETPKPTHHSSIVVGIILILIFVNQIEIPCYHPRPRTGSPDVTKLL